MTRAQFSKLTRLENEAQNRDDWELIERTFWEFEIESIEFNGHFGANFFFTVCTRKILTDKIADVIAAKVQARLELLLKTGK